ncbi:VC0807 family protein [Amycolatopsis carbonis]|uniref:VC0807 family protein n=1 Tax=Amycolatopsis carbonis TaxID=715471 RepID=A0A9Y2INX1_9PSEU|nr:VC0807 family protein [Amycolatopsis sp. 2-15]WIX82083.1 VC0807 family protein [Amycolatopsis sp. 2-15]
MTTLAPPEKPTTPPELRRELIVNLAINLVAPAALFYGLRALGVNQWLALLAGVVPPAVRAVQTVVTKRRVDTLAVFTLSILVLSVATSFLSGSPRFLLAKDGWMTAAAGLWMLATLLRTPFLYQVLRSFLGQAARDRMERNWLGSPTYRHVLRVTTASLAGISAATFDPVYSASKHAIIGLVRSLAPACADSGITLNAVCPGFVETRMIGGLKDSLVANGLAVASPAEIASAVATIAAGEGTGEAWMLQAGRAPERVEFPVVELSQV